MFYHVIEFDTVRNFGLFIGKVGNWWKELVTSIGGKIDDDCHYHAVFRSEKPLEKDHQIDIQGMPYVLETTFNIHEGAHDDAQVHEGAHDDAQVHEDEDESVVALDSQLGKDVVALLNHYFPGTTVKRIEAEYHEGVFVGDYSLKLMCEVSHPILMGAVLGFNNHNVPGRPRTWKDLCACQVDLYVTQFTLDTPQHTHTNTYGLPGMFAEEMKAWANEHPDGTLYSYVETPEMFLFATELLGHSHEDLRQAAELLSKQAKAKEEEERRNFVEFSNGDDPFGDTPLF